MSDQAILTIIGITAVLGIVLFVLSLKSYTIPVDSFRQQLAGAAARPLRNVTVKVPKVRNKSYASYAIDHIECLDKKGMPYQLKNGPAIEIRFTDNNNKKTVFFFDTLQLDGSLVSGALSRIMPDVRRTIDLQTIRKIEVQNGRKYYKYV